MEGMIPNERESSSVAGCAVAGASVQPKWSDEADVLKRVFVMLVAAVTIPLAACSQRTPLGAPPRSAPQSAQPSPTTNSQENSVAGLPEPAASGYVEANGVRIWHQIYGEGDPLVLLHGGFGTVEMFGPNIARLAATRKVIGVDLQAHGGTGPLGRPMTYEALATDVAELIHALGHEKADLMGYSLGAAVALRVAIDHPQVVDRLVMVSGAHAYSSWHKYNYEGMRAMAVDPTATAQSLVGTPQHQGYVAKAPGGQTSWDAAVAEFVAFIGQDYDWSAEIPSVTAPTLLVVGDWDAVQIGAATKLFELLGGGARDANWDRSGMGRNRFAVLPNTTHYDIINTTAPSEVAIPFLDGYPEPAAPRGP